MTAPARPYPLWWVFTALCFGAAGVGAGGAMLLVGWWAAIPVVAVGLGLAAGAVTYEVTRGGNQGIQRFLQPGRLLFVAVLVGSNVGRGVWWAVVDRDIQKAVIALGAFVLGMVLMFGVAWSFRRGDLR